ncbi:MAG TPA: hypothetical protein IAB10_02445 [Candidatus Avilachnospira avistercoris]|nr:hypothetical protein [Candidatus Avilachnospira avistercoris]
MGRGGGRSGGFSSGRGFSGRSSFSGRGFSSRRSSVQRGGSAFGGGSSFGSGSMFGGTRRGMRNVRPGYQSPVGGGSSLWPFLLFPRRRNTVVINNYGRDTETSPGGSGGYTAPSAVGSGDGTGTAGGIPDNRTQRGCSLTFLIVLGLMIELFFIFLAVGAFSDVPKEPREKLGSELCTYSPIWYEDRLGWIHDEDELILGLEDFYEETGVQPFLYICGEIEGRGWDLDNETARAFLESMYGELFDDEGHLIYVFMEYEPSQFISFIYTGSAADTVIDDEAKDIILDHTEELYYSDLSDEEFFSEVFSESGKEIMSKGSRGTAYLFTALAILLPIGMALYGISAAFKRKKEEEAERLRKILETPIGESEEERELRQKYMLREDEEEQEKVQETAEPSPAPSVSEEAEEKPDKPSEAKASESRESPAADVSDSMIKQGTNGDSDK